MKSNSTRNYGVDILRLLSMLMIVFLHLLSHGGLLDIFCNSRTFYSISLLFNTVCVCAVDTFAIISGFVGYKSKFRLSRGLSLWVSMITYTVGFMLIMSIASHTAPSIGNVVTSVSPVLSNTYWYLSAYFILFLVSPLLNKAVTEIDKDTLKTVLLIGFVVFSVISTVIGRSPDSVNFGYSAVWLCYLYILGAYIGMYAPFDQKGKTKSISVFLVVAAITWGAALLIEYIGNRCGTKISFLNLSDYTSPSVIIMSVALLNAFSKINVTGEKAIGFIKLTAPSAIGVYIIHENPYFREAIVERIFTEYLVGKSNILLLFSCIVIAVSIFVICLAVDILRRKLFELIGIKKLIAKTDKQN